MSSRGRRRVLGALRWVAIIGVVVLDVAAVVLRGAASRWEAEIERELAAVEASGAPLGPEDVAAGASDGPPWWAEIDSSIDPVFDLRLDDAGALDALLAGPDDDFAPFDRALLEELAAAYDAASEDDVLYGVLSDPLPSVAGDLLPDRGRLAFARVEAVGMQDRVAAARAACDGSRFDARAWIDGWLAGTEPYPEPDPVFVPIAAQKALAREAWLAALDGDEASALEFVRLGFCAARAYESTPGVYHSLVWHLQAGYAVRSLLLVARHLPEADLSEFEAPLRGLAPRERLARTLEEERAIGRRVFTGWFPDAAGGSWFDPFRGLVAGLFESHDERVYLRTYARLIDAARGPSVPARAASRAIMTELAEEEFALRSILLIPAVGSLFDTAYDLEARVTLARAVLHARREGPAEARLWITAREDPFSGEPYRADVDASGALRAWSVGRDGVDDRGVDVAPPGAVPGEGVDLVVVLAES